MTDITESDIEYSTYPVERPTLMIKCKTYQDYIAKKQQILQNQKDAREYREIKTKAPSLVAYCLKLVQENNNLKSQIESKLAQADKRLTDNMVKIVVCIKCGRHRTPYGEYPTKMCQCGSYQSEERDTTLEELFAESKELSQLRPIVKALRDEIKQLEFENTHYEVKSIPWQARKFMLDRIESILASSGEQK